MVYTCVRKADGFGALLIAQSQGYGWVEPIILDGRLCFPKVPRSYDFAPETFRGYGSREEAVEAAREAGGQVDSFSLRRDALEHLDELSFLVKGRREDWILDGQGFRETLFAYP
jgi:hypothetical protein